MKTTWYNFEVSILSVNSQRTSFPGSVIIVRIKQHGRLHLSGSCMFSTFQVDLLLGCSYTLFWSVIVITGTLIILMHVAPITNLFPTVTLASGTSGDQGMFSNWSLCISEFLLHLASSLLEYGNTSPCIRLNIVLQLMVHD